MSKMRLPVESRDDSHYVTCNEGSPMAVYFDKLQSRKGAATDQRLTGRGFPQAEQSFYPVYAEVFLRSFSSSPILFDVFEIGNSALPS